MRFKQEYDNSSIEVETEAVGIHEAVEHFVYFLRACGYHDSTITDGLIEHHLVQELLEKERELDEIEQEVNEPRKGQEL